MELRHLRYFTTVAAEGSFSRAAEKLSIAQPPLSRQVQQLEEELGVRLLDRGRPLTLTEPGRYLFEQSRQILQRVEDVRAMTRRIAKGMVLQFNIGFVASTLYDDLPELIRRFRITVPGVEVHLLEMTTLEQVAALKDGRIDIGFGRLRFDDPLIIRKVIREERLCIAAPKGHPLVARGTALRLKDAAGEPLILYPRAPRPGYADQAQSCLQLTRLRGDNRIDLRIMSYRKNDSSRLLAQLVELVRLFDRWDPALETSRSGP